MITIGYKKSLVTQLKFNKLFCGSPYEWDDVNGVMRIVKSRWRRVCYEVLVILATIHLLWITNNTRLHKGVYPSSYIVNQLGWISGFSSCCFIHIFATFQKKRILLLVNSLIAFERRNMASTEIKKAFGKGDLSAKLFMAWLGGNSFTVGSAYAFLILTDGRCACAYAGYEIIPCLEVFPNQPFPPIWTRLAVALPQMFIGSFSTSCVIYIIHSYMLSVKCLALYCKVIQSFETMKADEKDVDKIIRVFREVQVITALYNDCFRVALLPAWALTWVICTVCSAYATLKLHSKLPWPGFLIDPQVTINGILNFGVGFRAGGTLNQQSLVLIKSWKESKMVVKNKRFRKFVRSAAPLKALFGQCNYLDEMTSLVFIDMCIDQTISCMIMYP